MSSDETIEQKTNQVAELTDHELILLRKQNSRIVSEFKAEQLEKDSKKNWDLFYKRNGDRFFKDRHWTTREFEELIPPSLDTKTLLEVGCGVGNFLFPLLQCKSAFFIYACDIAPVAIDIIKSNKFYNEDHVKAFVSDVTKPNALAEVPGESVDIVTLIFVLSAIHPKSFDSVLSNLYRVLKPGAIVLLRDYGLYDMTQLRFKPGHKILDNFYMRQDGTRSYFFSVELLRELFLRNKFEEVEVTYVKRRTINKKEGVDASRTFIQAKFRKEELKT